MANFSYPNIATYSEDELVIGSWLGKPLYRRVIVKDVLVQRQRTYEQTIQLTDTEDIDEIVWYSGSCYTDDGKQYIFPNFESDGKDDKEFVAYLQLLNKNVYVVIRIHNINKLKVFIEYTRFSDGDFKVPNLSGDGTTSTPVLSARVDKVDTLNSEDKATASVSLNNDEFVFNFALPRGKDGLNGKDGIDGKDGEKGEQGNPGQDGKDGLTPYISTENGHWMIGTKDTGVIAEGKNGVDGKDGRNGLNGVDGKDGITPHIDMETGTWWIGNEDTHVRAIGLDGNDGEDGEDGETPWINPKNNHWMIGDKDTGVDASGSCRCDDLLESLREQLKPWIIYKNSLVENTSEFNALTDEVQNGGFLVVWEENEEQDIQAVLTTIERITNTSIGGSNGTYLPKRRRYV